MNTCICRSTSYMYIVHRTCFIVHRALYIVHRTSYIVHRTLYVPCHSMLPSVHVNYVSLHVHVWIMKHVVHNFHRIFSVWRDDRQSLGNVNVLATILQRTWRASAYVIDSSPWACARVLTCWHLTETLSYAPENLRLLRRERTGTDPAERDLSRYRRVSSRT